MKKLLLLTKTLLAAALLCVGQNAWATDVPYTIGSEGCGYRAEYSDPYTVKNGETLHITFTNNNYGTATVWNNYMLEATSAVDKHDGVYFDLRGDNYAFDQGTFVQNYNGNCTSDLNGATVDNYITYAGGVITVNQIFTKAEVTTYNRVYTYTVAGSPASVIIYVTEEAAQVTITNVETSKWTTVWNTDFSSTPTGISYSHPNATVSITDGKLLFYNGSNSDRTATVSFDDDAFEVATNWIMEYDWGASSPNTNSTTLNFVTDQGTAFSIAYDKYDGTATITSSTSTELTTTLPINNYPKAAPSTISHFKIEGVTDDGIYLTVTCGGVTYVNKQKVTSSFGYPTTFTGSTGKAQNYISFDNISFKTPAVAGFVATPTSEVTRADGTNRKFTLSCLTDGATIYYATSDLEKGAAGWVEYTGEVSTAAATIYAYAADDEDNTSEKMNFATGAGTTIDLLPATVTHSNNGVYTIASNQSAILGAPTATIHYQIDGGSEQTSTNASVNVNIAADGTLTYWLTADGYGATDPADETVYAAVGYAVTRTIDFKTSNSNDWAVKGDATTVTGDTHTYYLYKDQSSNLIAEDILATSFENAANSWRIQRYYGGTSPYNNTEYIALKNLTAGQIIQFACTSAPSIVANLTAVPASTYTGTFTYSATADGDVIVSLAKGVVITTIKLCATTVSATIGSTGWATFSSDYALDFTGISDFEAYMITGHEGNVVTKSKVEGTVPAGTGLLLKGDEDSYNIPVVASSSTDVSANKLVAGTGESVSAEGGKTKYVLGVSGSDEAEFQKIVSTAATVAKGKAYLQFNEEILARTMSFVGDITGVETVEAVSEAKAKEGKFIENGKLVIVKNGVKYNAAGAKLY